MVISERGKKEEKYVVLDSKQSTYKQMRPRRKISAYIKYVCSSFVVVVVVDVLESILAAEYCT